jgi:hypothetical protein
MIISVDTRVHFEHVQVIRCDIAPKSVKKCRDVKNEPISGKKLSMPLDQIFKTPLYFLKREEETLRTYL